MVDLSPAASLAASMDRWPASGAVRIERLGYYAGYVCPADKRFLTALALPGRFSSASVGTQTQLEAVPALASGSSHSPLAGGTAVPVDGEWIIHLGRCRAGEVGAFFVPNRVGCQPDCPGRRVWLARLSAPAHAAAGKTKSRADYRFRMGRLAFAYRVERPHLPGAARTACRFGFHYLHDTIVFLVHRIIFPFESKRRPRCAFPWNAQRAERDLFAGTLPGGQSHAFESVWAGDCHIGVLHSDSVGSYFRNSRPFD